MKKTKPGPRPDTKTAQNKDSPKIKGPTEKEHTHEHHVHQPGIETQAEEALRESEIKLRTIIDILPVGISVLDAERRIVYENPALRKIVQMTPEGLKRGNYKARTYIRPDGTIMPPEEYASIRATREKKTIHNIETGITLEDGKVIWTDVSAVPVALPDWKVVVITDDITERKRAEEALRESEEINKSIIKNSLDSIKILDTSGNLLSMSESGQKLLEIRDITQYIGTSWIDFWTGEDHTAAEKAVVLAAEGGVGRFTGYCPTEKGAPRWWDVVITPMKDQDGEVVRLLSISRDVTGRRRADEALRENERKLQEIVHGSPVPQFVIDKDHRIISWNRALEEYSRIKADEMLGTRSAWKAFYEKERPVMADLLIDGSVDKIPEWYAGKYSRSKYVDGAFEATDFFKNMGTGGVWLHFTAAPIRDSKGTLIGAIETLEDITERRQAEEALRKTLSLLNASLESTADGILVVDTAGKITSYNQNFANMWNIPPGLLEPGDNKMTMNNVLPLVRDPEGFLASIRELRAHPGRESYDMIEFRDGRIFERYSKPQKIGDAVVGRVWSFRDVTDRKRAEEKLVASLQEKEVLLHEIHHRVKNNLQLISGLLDLTRIRTPDESTNSILTDLMQKILTMAQIHTRLYESKQFGKISLGDQIRDQIAALSDMYSQKGHKITCEINSVELYLTVDQAIPCALVVNEILSNAYKHAFKGRQHGTIEISVRQENGQVRITVRDDGIGMPADLDISRTNTLGIKLIRTLVQFQLKGSLMMNSRNGTEIIVEFPMNRAGT